MERIFNIDEDGQIELNIDNIDESYLESVFYNSSDLINNGSISYPQIFRILSLKNSLGQRRFIEDPFLKSQSRGLKKDLFSFYDKVLKPLTLEEVDEDSPEDIDYILEEYEKMTEHLLVVLLIRNGLIDDDNIELLEDKISELSKINSGKSVDAVKSLTLYGYSMTLAVLKNKNFDEYIRNLPLDGKGQQKNRNLNIRYKYDLLTKEFSVQEIEEAKQVILGYKKKFQLKTLDEAIGDFVSIEDYLATMELIQSEREVFELIEEREEEYKRDLAEEEKRSQREEEEKRRKEEERKREEERKKLEAKQKEFEKYSNFEDNGTYGPKEIVIPIALNYFMKEGKTFSEILSEEEQKELFDKIKSLPLKKNERVALVIFSDLKKYEALRVLNDFRDLAEEHGVSGRLIEGITTEFGEELVFDEKNSRKINRWSKTGDTLGFIREHIKEHIPALTDDKPDVSYLRYTYDSMTTKQFEKTEKQLREYIGMVGFLKVPDKNMFIGIPREKMPFKVRKGVAKYLNLKYLINPKFLDAFSDSKRVDEYGIDDEGREEI